MSTIGANPSSSAFSSTLEKASKLMGDISLRHNAVRYKITNVLGHNFEPMLLTGITYCSQCGKIIWFAGQTCKLCKLVTHKKCMHSTSWHCLSLEVRKSNLHEKVIGQPSKHNFSPKYFCKLTYCDHCGTLIKGIVGCQGLVCDERQGGCGMTVHHSCESLVPEHCCYRKNQSQSTPATSERPGQWIDSPVSIRDFDILRLLNKGSFSKVYLAKLKSSNHEYAIKVYNKTDCVSTDPESVLTEMRVLNLGRQYPFLATVHCCFQSEDRLYFVLEYTIGQDLDYYLLKYRKFREDWTRFYSAEIVLALEYLHSQDIIHRDLKLQHVIIDQEGHCKLIDFGMSKDLGKTGIMRTRTFCGTQLYMSPEILRNEDYDFSVDWWTLGVVMFQLMVGYPPFENDDEDLLQFLILTEEVQIPSFLGHNAKSIIAGLLKKHPHQRLGCSIIDGGVQELKEHPFFQQFGSDEIFWDNWKDIETKRIKPPIVPGAQDLQVMAGNYEDQDRILTPISHDQLKQIEQTEFEDFSFYSDSFKRILQQS